MFAQSEIKAQAYTHTCTTAIDRVKSQASTNW